MEIKGRIRMLYWLEKEKAEGRDILYSTDFDVFKTFGLKVDKAWDLTVIDVGTILTIPSEPKKVKVHHIYTYFQEKEQIISEEIGINLYGQGKNHPFNFMVTYYVTQVE